MIASVRYIDVVGQINCDSFRRTELPVARAAGAPAHDETTAGSKFFNSVVTEVSNVNIAGRIDRNASGPV